MFDRKAGTDSYVFKSQSVDSIREKNGFGE